MSDTIAPGTVAHEALQYLRTHGEASTTALAKGIGRSAKRLAQHLSPALRAGLLARRVDGGFAFWRLGANADQMQPPQEPTPDEQDRQRVVKVSAHAMPSIFAYADQRAAAPFSVAISTDGRMNIERHGRVLLELTNEERLIVVKAAAQGVQPRGLPA